jgi:hypothetical protein
MSAETQINPKWIGIKARWLPFNGMLDEGGPCRAAAACHPFKPIVQYCQIPWMGDKRYGRKRCSICGKSVFKPRQKKPVSSATQRRLDQ